MNIKTSHVIVSFARSRTQVVGINVTLQQISDVDGEDQFHRLVIGSTK